MKNDKQLNVTAGPGVSELIIREGSATEPIRSPKSINIVGILDAPFQFWQSRTKQYDHKDVHLLVRKDVGSLELHINDTSPTTEHVIKGAVKRNPVLNEFKINTEARWGVREFVKFIRTMRYYFADPAECNAMVESLNKWEAKVETVIKEFNNQNGSSLTMLEKKVGEVQLKTKFNLSIPIFQGYAKDKFTVEIGLDPKNTSVDLYLISDELYELEINRREAIVESAVEQFKLSDFSIVVVS